MIYDSIRNIELYRGINDRIYKVLTFIRDTDFSAWDKEQYELEKDTIKILVKEYQTNEENITPETHEKFIDIQYLITGRELISVGRRDKMREIVTADPEHDIWFYHGDTFPLILQDDLFMIFWPEDAHAPGISINGQKEFCRKVIGKIRID